MKISGRYFDVYLGEVKKGEPRRVYIVVSTKVSKKAVNRNLSKRRLREIVRLMDPKNELNIKIIASPSILKARFSELKDDFMKAITKFNEDAN